MDSFGSAKPPEKRTAVEPDHNQTWADQTRAVCDDHPVPEQHATELVPARVVEAYDQMMRQVIGPALRQLQFRGTLREFKYGDRSQFGAVRWQKDGRAARAQLLAFTANVDYWCGADRIGWLMPVPAHDTWWDIRGGQSYDSVAESVISAVRQYVLPAIQAGLEDLQRPDVNWSGAGGYLGDRDDGGARTSSFFVRPTGSSYDEQFASFTSGMPYERLDAAEIVTECAASDPRTVPALVDRLRHDPQRGIRKMIASRMLCLFTDHPDVVAALQVTAADDSDTGVRWAARYALRLSGHLMAHAPTS
jgi:HEAT repeats